MAGDRINFPFLIGGVAALGIVATLAAGAEQRALQARRLAESSRVASLADAIAGSVQADLDVDLPMRITRVGASEPEVARISLLQATDEPDRFIVLADWSRQGNAVAAGTEIAVADSAAAGLATGDVRESIVDVVGDRFTGLAPLEGSAGPVGVAAVVLEPADLDLARARSMRSTAAVFGLSALGFGLLAMVGRAARTSQSAGADAETTQPYKPLGEGGYEDRIDDLARGMQQREFIRETFGRYVSSRLAEALADNAAMIGAGEGRQVTVLSGEVPARASFADADPSEVVTMVNDVLRVVGEVIDAHGGYVLDVQGERFLAVFGAPVRMPDQVERAVRCALAIPDRLAGLAREWEKLGRARIWRAQGNSRPPVHIGLCSGRVVAGNVGSATRVRYTIVGEAVDLAFGLERLNRELSTQILATDAVLEALPEGMAKAVDRGMHALGRPQGGRVAEVRVHSFEV